MRNHPSLFILIIVTSLSSCAAKSTKKEVLDYYINIKYENVIPCFNLIMQQNKRLNVFGKEALQKNTRTLSKEQLIELDENHETIIIKLNEAIEKLNDMEDIEDLSKFKVNSIKHLNELIGFENEFFKPVIELFKDGILDNEIDLIIEKLSHVTKMKESSERYKKMELDFLNEFEISMEEVGVLNNKYGF
jgi:hypothetical protein